ncbi:MAG: vWA domain-containing protein [Candidatus Paceibacterota bacterium]
MSLWSIKRRFFYLSIVSVFALVVFVIPAFLFFYKAPTCFDERQNGDELGVDCGGSCALLCPFNQADPLVRWARLVPVTEGFYSAVAMIENSNINAQAKNVAYKMTVYDKFDIVLEERVKRIDIPSQTIFPVFESAIKEKDGRIPSRVLLEFITEPVWERVEGRSFSSIEVRNQLLSDRESRPRLDAQLVNTSPIQTFEDVVVNALIYDTERNLIGASQTFVEYLDPDERVPIVFTWPEPFQVEQRVCEQPTDVLLVIDRSGSMDDDGKSPPEPLTSVKEAATSFVSQLGPNDRAGVVTFATEASRVPDASLTDEISSVESVLSAIAIGTDGVQYTNIGDGLEIAYQELKRAGNTDNAQVIVLLTDGRATHPLNPSIENYADVYALEVSNKIRSNKMTLYTIGLGTEINSDVLQQMAGSPSRYFNAPDTEDLFGIYDSIARSICDQGPAVIDITPLPRLP